MARHLDPDQRALALAARQHAVLSHAQARSVGLSDRQIAHRIATGRWRRPSREVYVVAGSPDAPEQRATIAYLAVQRADGLLSHVTAAWCHGLLPPSPLPHVTVPPCASARCPIAKVHRSVVAAVDRSRRDGLVLTSVSRTIVDLGGVLDRPTLAAVVDDAFCRKVATAASVVDAAGRVGSGRRGLDLVQTIVVPWVEAIEPGSPAEVRLLRMLVELGVTGLVSQHDVHDASGAFVARLDLADPARRVGFEYDGRQTHNPRYWARDEARYARLRELGWWVESITKLDLLPGEPRLRSLVASWVARAA